MSTNKISFGTITALVLGGAPLANGAARQSTKVDLSSLRFLDGCLDLEVTTGAGSLAANPSVDVYIARSLDGTKFAYGATGVDGSFDPAKLAGYSPLGFLIPRSAGALQDPAVFDTLAGPNAALGFTPYFSVIVVNNTGVTLSAYTLRFMGQQVASE